MSSALGPLSGIFVTDLSNSISGAWCSRLLADYGADVVVVEQPEGHMVRLLKLHDTSAEEVLSEWFLANKRSVMFESGAQQSLHRVRELYHSSDVIILPEPTSVLAEADELVPDKRQITVSISSHGSTGKLAQQLGNELTAAARSGWASINGTLGRGPLKPSGWQTSYSAGTFGALGVMAALLQRESTGHGESLSISELDATVSMLSPGFLQSQYSGEPLRPSPANDLAGGPVRIADGYFALTLSRAHFWRDAMTLLGLDDLANDPKWESQRNRRENKSEYMGRVIEAMSTWSKTDLFEELALRRVVAGPVLDMKELIENQHLEERGFWQHLSDGVRSAVLPGPAAKMSATPLSIRRLAPAIGAHNNDFDNNDEPVTSPQYRIDSEPVGSLDSSQGPLAGYTGIVLTQAWAGTYCTMLLAMMGANVIQVEVRSRPDGWRGGYEGEIPPKLRDRETAIHPWNCGPLYNSVNLGKRCVTLDLSDPDGLKIFRELVEEADFIAENFSPRVMKNFGVDYEALKEIKPDVILCSLSAYGHTGPWANVPGIGGTIEPSSGMSSLLGYEDGIPLNSGQMYPDAVAGLNAATALTAALVHRKQTGVGQFIDLSMMEANLTFVGEAATETLWGGAVPGPIGNKHRTWAPHGIYECHPDDQGNPSHIAIGCENEQQWSALSSLIGDTSSSFDYSEFDTLEKRKRNETVLDEILSAFCALQFAPQLCETLSHNGVPSAVVMNTLEVSEDPDLIERKIIQMINHPEAGPAYQATLPIHFTGRAITNIRHSPRHGEHSWEVFSDLLSMDYETFARLKAKGVTGEGPPP